LRLFCVACCRRVLTPSHDPLLSQAITVAEGYADASEQRSSLNSARKRVAALAAIPRQGRVSYSLSDLSPLVEAVRLLCLPGMTVGDPSTVLAWIAEEVGKGVARANEQIAQCALIRDIFGNPFRPVTFSPAWRTDTAVSLARQMYESREFGAMPILADALQDAGCDNDDILGHCRDPQQIHVRGCWVVDLVLGKS
jgi:hypothetical protein